MGTLDGRRRLRSIGYLWAPSLLVLEHGEMEVAALDEPESLVDANRGIVVGEYVKEGSSTLIENVFHHGGHKCTGIAAAASIGMGADGADFDESGDTHALTGH